MGAHMAVKLVRSGTPRNAAVAVANVIRALDQASKPKASRRCREVRRCCPPTPPTSVWSSVSV